MVTVRACYLLQKNWVRLSINITLLKKWNICMYVCMYKYVYLLLPVPNQRGNHNLSKRQSHLGA